MIKLTLNKKIRKGPSKTIPFSFMGYYLPGQATTTAAEAALRATLVVALLLAT
jgi:hypothetical protein